MRPSLPFTTFALAIGLASCRSAQQSATTTSAPNASGAATVSPSGSQDLVLRGDFKGPLGVQLYSVRNAISKDVPGTLARVRALGFREVELAGTYGLTASTQSRLFPQSDPASSGRTVAIGSSLVTRLRTSGPSASGSPPLPGRRLEPP